MVRLLPFAALASFGALFGMSWIVIGVDPDTAPWYVFASFVVLLFVFSFCLLGTLLYFLRTRLYKRYSASWYFKTSFKMSFFVALFLAIAAILAMLQLVTIFNVVLAILAIILFAVWSYLGKRTKDRKE